MRVLITGSSGQIGTITALALLARGDSVQGVDRRPNPWTKRIPTAVVDLGSLAPGAAPVAGRFDAVLHLAAHAKVFELVRHPVRALENIQVAFNVLEYCRQAQTPFIFGSSREVYGDIHRHITNEAEADFVVAESPYSASKISAEACIYAYARCYALPCIVFRFSNVYGRYDCDLERLERVVPLFIRRIAAGREVVVYGPGKVLDFTHVDDCTAGVVSGIDAVASGRLDRETVNLAFGRGSTLRDLVDIIGRSLGVEPRMRCEPARTGEVTRYVAELTKARNLLGYQPAIPLDEGVPQAIAWQRAIGVLAGTPNR